MNEGEPKLIAQALASRGLLERVLAIVALHPVNLADVLGRRRTKAIAAARHEVWIDLHDGAGLSWPEVGELFGRDHTTVMAARSRSKVQRRLVLEDRVAEEIAAWLEGWLGTEDRGLIKEQIAAIRRGDWRQ